ncbi:uncharacterized protein CDV56_106367 [Aspergillus thermomutatus]|uniref:Uncharacterized protein n=1 Tax=Aspergillus thermomutatus TaxID=41047 RepID=A0A397GYU7_ASPTH|nr:uncharacterized protein CDV56_106367 [Aspergillus thermomutatus]RHZ54243.1 hypothetical protein CDV56_106367 [Aspergillus thermomutatus]
MAVRSESWKASQREKKRRARRELRQQRGYDANAHRQKDAERTRGRASRKTKERYRERVRKYEEFLIEERNMPESYEVGEGHPAPTLEELKEFIRWLIDSTKGKLASNGRLTMDTILVRAQEFVPGFYLETGNEIARDDRAELYHWIENELVEEGVLSTIRKPKYDLDFERAIIALWAIDDPFFISGRYRVQFHLITLQFLCTGARVSSFTPASENKVGRGLRYRNIELVLFRADNAPWRIGWRLDQQFVKNNKDPENTMFGTAIWDCDEPIYSGALYLLALALADNALYGFSSPEEVVEQRIPEGEDELVLRWNEEAKDRCIIRGVTAGRVSEDPLTKEKYQADFRKIPANACYFMTATIHAMCRALGKAVKSKYSSAHVAQILTQKSKTVYGNDYLANCSGVDVFNALRGRLADHTHINYFQGYGQFHEHGLPRRLPIEEERKIDANPRLVAKAMEIQNAESNGDTNRLKRNYSILKRGIYSSTLQRYQSEWVQSQRDWKILTRGRERPDHAEQTAEKQAQCKLMPELGRLAAIMSSKEPLSFDEKAVAVKDLYTQCLRDFDVVYRPGEEPLDGRCPVDGCDFESMRGATTSILAFDEKCLVQMESLPKSHVSTDEQHYRRHLHDAHHYNKAICVPSEKARKKRSSSEIDEESVADGNPPKRQRRPRRQRKTTLAPSNASTKDLKIILWGPPTTNPQAMFPLPAEAEHENEECLKDLTCQAINHCENFSETLYIGQDGDSIRSASSDTPNLTDNPGPSAISSVPGTIPIDPRILDVSTTILSYLGGELQQYDECNLSEQLASSPLAEQP